MKKTCAWLMTDLKIGGGELIPLLLLPELHDWDGVLVLFKVAIQHVVPPGLRVVALGGEGRLRGHLPATIRATLRASRGADLLVGGLEGAPIIVAAICGLLSRRPIVGVVPTHLERHAATVRMSAIEWRLLRWALGRCGAVITASEDGRDALVNAGVQTRRVHVIPNPVSPWALRGPRAPKPESSTPRILTVGRLEPAKGMDVLLEAARLLEDVPFEWEVVGGGSQESWLRERAAAIGLEPKVRFAGRVDDLRPHFERADCFVLASRLEGMSIAVLEAMASGLPVIATRSGRGVEEALEGGRSGILVPAEDPAGLAQAVRELLRDPARARTLGEAASRRARDFEPATIARAYGLVFDAVLARRASPG